ncbi:DUF3343 domain-containing protein [bacterium]|nr:MAG: DUF3343 domain-containing protein [bacterium]
MVRDGLLIFNSVHKVMKAEKLLKGAGLNARVMPVPRQLSSDCGLALALPFEDVASASARLSGQGVEPEEIWRLAANGDYERVRL